MEKHALNILQQIAENVKGIPPEVQMFIAAINILILGVTLYKLFENTNITRKEYIGSIRPYLRLQKAEPLVLVNEGRGIAINIKLTYKKGKIRKQFKTVTAMASAPGSITNVKDFIDGTTNIELNPEVNPYAVEAKYKDIEGTQYLAIFEFDYSFNDRFKIVKQEKI